MSIPWTWAILFIKFHGSTAGGSMRIYLDNSALSRIFDNQSQPRIFMEANAMEVVFLMIEDGSLEIVSSEVIEYENNQSPYTERRAFIVQVLTQASARQDITAAVTVRAREISVMGCKAIDSLHLASAEALGADVFLTCDDGILKRYRGILKTLSPVDFVLTVTRRGRP